MKNDLPDNKTTWKLVLSYDGTDFHGWQIQPGSPTIQGLLSDAIASVTGERVLPQGSGRTDAGVHAVGQVASFALSAPIPEQNLQRALNRILPRAIRILSAQHAAPEFHARHSALGKIYQYRIFCGTVCTPFLARYALGLDRQLNCSAMQRAAESILGEHDFTSFAATDPDRTSRIQSSPEGVQENARRIELSEWTTSAIAAGWMSSLGTSNDAENLFLAPRVVGDATLLTYTVHGNGFLHHMVRNLVGTFLEVGLGRISPEAMLPILHGRQRNLAGPTAPARGLCLMKVLY